MCALEGREAQEGEKLKPPNEQISRLHEELAAERRLDLLGLMRAGR